MRRTSGAAGGGNDGGIRRLIHKALALRVLLSVSGTLYKVIIYPASRRSGIGQQQAGVDANGHGW